MIYFEYCTMNSYHRNNNSVYSIDPDVWKKIIQGI